MRAFSMIVTCFPVFAAALAAQAPQLFASPAQRPGQPFDVVVAGVPGQSYATLIDLSGGPTALFGQTFLLGSTPLPLDVGQLPASGLHALSIPTAANVPTGVPLFLQTLALDLTGSALRHSDGESTAFYRSSTVLVEKLVDPLAQGYTGAFDQSVVGRLQGMPVTRRTQTVMPVGAVPFNQGVQSPLNPSGARLQMVYRAGDLGATGQPEVVTSLRWKPFATVLQDTFPRVVIELSHSLVVPDYTIDPFSALPAFPLSGLSKTFSSNIKPTTTPVRVVDAAYPIRASAVQPDGYLAYPAPTREFQYNGLDSLLVDVFVPPTASASGINGQSVSLMVLSSPDPNSRVLVNGMPSNQIDPFAATAATSGDNSLHALQVEFAQVESIAESPWRRAPVANPDYHTPSIAASGQVLVEYRGSLDGGLNAGPWTSNIDFADGMPYLQFRVTMHGDAARNLAASLDAIVVPIN